MKAALTGFLLSVLFACVADGAQPPARQPPRGAPVVNSPQAADSEAESAVQDESEKQAEQEKRQLDRQLVRFNGDLARYTEWLAVIAALQFVALGVQAFFLRKAFQEAQRSGDIARESMIAGERAFVFSIGLRNLYETDPAGTISWRFRPRWKNTGDTPTKNMVHYTECVVRTSPLPAGFDLSSFSPENAASGLLAPNGEGDGGQAPRSSGPAVSPQDILDAQQRRKWIYIWGWARYLDVFPGSSEHITRFCFVITPVGNPLASDAVTRMQFPFYLHQEGNCCDDECEPKRASLPTLPLPPWSSATKT